MKKLTASNDSEGSKPKAGPDMRSINVEDANKKPGMGSRFTKIGGGAAGAGGSRFKKVGVAVSGTKEGYGEGKKEESAMKVVSVPAEDDTKVPIVETQLEKQEETRQDDDVVMADDDDGEEAITWEEYDFTKPTGCDHASCAGCKTDGVWSGEWMSVGTT